MRYYCHSCHTQVDGDDLLADYTCPQCGSGFVEEIPVTSRRESLDESSSQREGGGREIDVDLPGFLHARLSSDEFSDDNSDVEFLDSVNGPLAQVFNFFQPTQSQQSATNTAPATTTTPTTTTTTSTTTSSTSSNAIAGSGQQTTPSTNNAQSTRPQARLISRTVNNSLGRNSGQLHTAFLDQTTNQTIADVLNDFITGVSFGTHYPDGGPSGSSQNSQGASSGNPIPNANRGLINIDFPLPFFLHSNPGDYAWGNAGFDAVITQLLNNLDGSNSGPPPMPKEQIQELPTVKISDEQVKSSNLQCTVCMEDFKVEDSARQLPCEHFFHQDCILPWLALHASCPICRKTFVAGTNTTTTTTQTLNSDATNQAETARRRPTEQQNATDAIVNAPSSSATTSDNGPNFVATSETAARTNPSTNQSTSSVTNQNVATKSYDYTEDDCD